MQLQKIIEKHWYYKNNPLLCLLLLPFSLIFYCISISRRILYQSAILKSFKLPVPVVIIGNITVGGAGKTPLTQYLADELTKAGVSVGVILRGYKSKADTAMVVSAHADSRMVGDEALIYARNNIRVAIGRNRYQAGLTLLRQYPDIQLILSDDGMQHYRLQRDYEIAVIDSSRMLGNRFVLPMGPLRETCSRLKTVDAVVINGTLNQEQAQQLSLPKLVITQTLVLNKIYNPLTSAIITPAELRGKQITAIAAIGNPQRFFDFLLNLGIKTSNNIAFPDHHQYVIDDLPKNQDLILVTEKDYSKLSEFNSKNIWVVLVKTQLDNPQLIEQIRQLV